MLFSRFMNNGSFSIAPVLGGSVFDQKVVGRIFLENGRGQCDLHFLVDSLNNGEASHG